MSGSPTLEPPLDTQGDTSLSSRDEDVAGETQHSQRMLSFSDGLLSIIATVMILPVTHTEISPEQEFDKGVQKLLATRIAVYLMTFLIVTVAWAAHARLFQIVGKIDDTLALLNLACMMTITFLPFTFSLMVTFPEAPLGIFLFCMCVVAIGGVQPLRPDISPQGPVPQAHPGPCASGPCPVPPGCRLLPVLLPGVLPADGHSHLPALCQQGHPLVLGKAHRPQAAAGPPRGQLPGPKRGPQQGAGRGLQRRGLRHRGHPTHPGHMPPASPGLTLRSCVSSESFSGLCHICRLPFCLFLGEDNVPDPRQVQERFGGSLLAALGAAGPRFLAYFGSFATVGLLWFTHHSLFLHVRRATPAMGLLNALSLAFVGGLPLAYQQTSAFARRPRDELGRVRVSCAITFLAGLFQFSVWTAALLRPGETLRPAARVGGPEHAFMFAKLALYPCASLLAFSATLVLSRFSATIFHLMQLAVPAAFLLLRLLVRLSLAAVRALHRTPGSPRDLLLPPE
ncbi:endosomal/lysosomal proton channel TMEM175 isoform X5 [Erinaceus europaeus]|nr:endosomal/lysosomal proton channel TMEM175 isoform X5 [Erinaceus europaeus]XP_060044371.1 endosomal/lysosomal proton channel TMEM175 isoform X5 [Erinaceus europaeus]